MHQAAHILGREGVDKQTAQKRLGGLLGAMARHRDKAGGLAPAVGHFLKVSRSYWPGLFHCYAVEGLPRTNNALEQLFGSYRHHERRVSGRKVASPALVLRGSARIIAAVATRQRPQRVKDLISADPRSGRSCAPSWPNAGNAASNAGGSAATRKATFANWRTNSSSRVCRRRKKLGRQT